MNTATSPHRQLRKRNGPVTGMRSSAAAHDGGLAIGETAIIRNAAANTAIAIYSTGYTSATETPEARSFSPMRVPTSQGVAVAHTELNELPIMLSWLPRRPPPPSELSIGLTTALIMQMKRPVMNAPAR